MGNGTLSDGATPAIDGRTDQSSDRSAVVEALRVFGTAASQRLPERAQQDCAYSDAPWVVDSLPDLDGQDAIAPLLRLADDRRCRGDLRTRAAEAALRIETPRAATRRDGMGPQLVSTLSRRISSSFEWPPGCPASGATPRIWALVRTRALYWTTRGPASYVQ